MMTLGDLGQLKPFIAPSGQEVIITPEEEAEFVKQAVGEKIRAGITMGTEIEKSAINAVGNAIGFAIGGFFVGLIIKGK